MVKGFLGSLLSGILFVILGIVSILIVGSNGDISEFSFIWSSKPDEMPDFYEGSSVLYMRGEDHSTTFTKDDAVSFELADKIYIDSSSVNTYIRPTDEDEIRVAASVGTTSIDFSAEYSDDTLTFEYSKPFSFFPSSSTAILISLPQKLYDEMTLDIGSGSTFIGEIKTEKLTVDMGSGGLYAKGISASESVLDIGSGDIDILCAEGFSGKSLDVELHSGDLKIINAAFDKYKVEVGSGDVTLYGLTGSGDVSLGSGDADMVYAPASSDEEHGIDIGSGSASAYVPDDVSGTLSLNVGAGKGKIELGELDERVAHSKKTFELDGGSDAAMDFNVTVGSGSFKMKSDAKAKEPHILDDFPF